MEKEKELRPQWRKKPKRKTTKELSADCHRLQTFLLRIIECDGADRDRAMKDAKDWLRKEFGGSNGYEIMAAVTRYVEAKRETNA